MPALANLDHDIVTCVAVARFSLDTHCLAGLAERQLAIYPNLAKFGAMHLLLEMLGIV